MRDPLAQPLAANGIETLEFGPDGLIPAIVQDVHSREVLMVGFTNREMLRRTVETGHAWFWSRHRQSPWEKGATSGHYLRVREIRRNCEDNSLLLLAEPTGPTCHTGEISCYYRRLDGASIEADRTAEERPWQTEGGTDSPDGERHVEGGLDWLYAIVARPQRREGSYVAQLLERGVDRIAKKIGEEAAEVIIAAKNRSPEELAREIADLWFHSLVLLLDAGMDPTDVYRVLAERHRGASGR